MMVFELKVGLYSACREVARISRISVPKGFPMYGASYLDPTTYQLYTAYKREVHRRDPTRIKGAHNKGPYRTTLGP